MNKKEMYSNEYFYSFFYLFIRILDVFIRHIRLNIAFLIGYSSQFLLALANRNLIYTDIIYDG